MPKLNNFSLSFTIIATLASLLLFCVPFSSFASTIVPGEISQDTTWTQAQSPYVVQGVTIRQGVTLTIDPGVVIKFKSNFSRFSVDGTLIVNGTATDRVYFTSYKDDSVGGDTNGDGIATSPDFQDWIDIRFNTGSTGIIKNAVVRYGGSRACTAFGCNGSQSGLLNNGGSVTISDSQFSYNNVYGIVQNSGSTSMMSSEIDHHTNGFFLGFGTTATISNSNFHDNSYGVTMSSGGSLTLKNNTFQNNSSGAASINTLVDFTHSGNTASGTGRKVFVMSGSITRDTTWNNDLPYLISGVIVDAGKTLTIDQGVIIKFINLNSSLVVNGNLNINGTKTAPVFLTSLKDDLAGGDTNGDGSASVPSYGDWAHLQFNAGSTGMINYAKVRYGGGFNEVSQVGSFSGININGGNVNISHSEIDHHGSYFYFLGITKYSGDLTISDSSIHDNLTYGLANSSLGSPIQAINNWWGDATGPYHAQLNSQGHGNRVSDNINFIPWLGYDPTKNQPPTLTNLHQYKSTGAVDMSEGAITTQHTIVFKATLHDPDTDQVKLQIELREFNQPFTGVDDGGILTSAFASSGDEVIITKTDIVVGAYKWRARVIDDNNAISAWQEFGIVGNIDFEVKSGNSSVAFLPGFEGSRLYKPGILFENRVWEPNRNDDVHKLYFNPNGTPQYNDVYTRDDIDQVYGALNNIYVGFNDSMKKLVDDKVINEFKILPYDWRLQLDDILTSGKKVGMDGVHANLSYTQATSSPYIIQEIERLARNSATGKTTIIAHSNGGLLAKRLMKKLEEKGEAHIIDKIIFVAVPQSGTAQALAALLHGHDQAFGFGFVLTQSNARTFGENVPASYNLLPHQKYFTDVSTPVVTFDSLSPLTQLFRNAYGIVINNRNELYQFLTGTDGRSKPAPEDTDNPNILNRTLLDRSLAIQDELDAWTPPQGIEVIQIAGWGKNTLSGITYTEKDNFECLSLSGCPPKLLDYKPEFIIDGDGIVPTPSAFAMGTSTVRSYYVDIHSFNIKNKFLGLVKINRAHADILEISRLEELISNIIQGKLELPQDVSIKEPPPIGTRLRFAVHSPVSLNLYDSLGNHTGISTTTHSGGDIQIIDEQIPNSYYRDFGEGKYAGADGVGTTTVNLLGKGLGTFTFDIEETRGNIVVASTTFVDIPVTASTTAVMDIFNLSSSSAPILRMDIDGDGTTDVNISSGNGISSEELLGVLRGVVKTLNLPQKKEKKFLKTIDKLDRVLEKEEKNVRKHKRHTKQAFNALEDTIYRFQKKNLLTKDEVDELINIIEQIRGKVVI